MTILIFKKECYYLTTGYIDTNLFKNGAEDIRKVIHYAELLLEMRYGERIGRL